MTAEHDHTNYGDEAQRRPTPGDGTSAYTPVSPLNPSAIHGAEVAPWMETGDSFQTSAGITGQRDVEDELGGADTDVVTIDERTDHRLTLTVGRIATHARDFPGVSRARLAEVPARVVRFVRSSGVVDRLRSVSSASQGKPAADAHLKKVGTLQRAHGDHYVYPTPHGKGDLALLDDGEYVQSERDENTLTVIWTTPDTPNEFVTSLSKLGSGVATLEVLTSDGRTHRVPWSRFGLFTDREQVSVVSCKLDHLSLRWRAPVVKAPGQSIPRSECALVTHRLGTDTARALLETTGTAQVARQGIDVLVGLDVLSRA